MMLFRQRCKTEYKQTSLFYRHFYGEFRNFCFEFYIIFYQKHKKLFNALTFAPVCTYICIFFFFFFVLSRRCESSKDTFVPTKECTIHYRWCLRTKPTPYTLQPLSPRGTAVRYITSRQAGQLKSFITLIKISSPLLQSSEFYHNFSHSLTILTPQNPIVQQLFHQPVWS